MGGTAYDGLLRLVAGRYRAPELLGKGLDRVHVHHEGCHLALAVLAHELTTSLHEPECRFERKRFRGDQRRVLAKAVTRRHRRLYAAAGFFTKYREARNVMCEQRGLSVPREVQLIPGVIE